MWKKVISEKGQRELEEEEPLFFNSPSQPIMAIHEEEEEKGFRNPVQEHNAEKEELWQTDEA